jgi:hypothetical protein
MSGFEPVVAQAAAAEVGTTALATEVMASNALAAANMAAYTPAAAGALSAIPAGLGALASAVPGMYGVGTATTGALSGGVPTLVEQLATTSPEVMGQLQTALKPAAFEGLNTTALETLAPDQIAQITGGIPTAGPGIETAYANTGLGNVTPEMLNQAPVAETAGYFNENTITQAQDNLIRANPGYSPDLPTQLQQHLLPTELTPEKLTELTTQNDALARTAAQYPQINPQAPGSPLGGLGDVFKGLYKDFKETPTKDKLLYGGVASLAAPIITNMLKKKKELGGADPYSGPLSKFQYDPARYTPLTVTPPTPYQPRYAQGGLSDLGGYSDYAGGGRMLKGPGDGMSDNIPATIAGKQPARLANEEFVIPADVVSHLGNGSSEAGAKQLYKMMDRVRQARTGKKAQGKQIKADKYMPT